MGYTGSLKPTTNREDWSEEVEVFDDETGDRIDLTNATIVFQFKNQDGYPVITADVVIVDLGVYTASVPVGAMRSLCPETYRAACTLAVNGITKEHFLGTIAVLDGVVS